MYENLMEEVVEEENRRKALEAVKRNQGAPGIDHMKTPELEKHLQALWERIRAKLLAGTWVPGPVRWVEIPKPSGGTRMLGIPTVMDRFIQPRWRSLQQLRKATGWQAHSVRITSTKLPDGERTYRIISK